MPPESPYQSTLRPEDFAARPGFKISIISFLVYLAGVAVHFFTLGGRELIMAGGPTAGVAIGGYVGVLLLAILISFFGFAFVPSRLAATIVFCLSIPALIFGDMKVNELANARIHPETVKAPTPKPVPGAPAATADVPVPGNPTYNATQRGTYSDQAGTAFINVREAKKKVYVDDNTAFAAAAGAGMGSLTTKEALAARRKLVADLLQANQDYMDFVANQETIYRGELEKTPLIPNDVNNSIGNFKAKNPFITDAVAARAAQRDALKAYDEMMAMLEQSFGRWKVTAGKLAFQKPADNEAYGKLQEHYKAAADLQSSTVARVNAEQTALAAGASPAEAAAKVGGTVDGPSSPARATASPAPAAGAVPASSLAIPATTAPPAPGVAPTVGNPTH